MAHPIRDNPALNQIFPKLREAQFSPEALAALGAIPNLAGNMLYGEHASALRRANPTPWDLKGWDVSQYGDKEATYNTMGFVPTGNTNHMGLQANTFEGLNSGRPTRSQIATLAHESLHGIQHTPLPSDLSSIGQVFPQREKFLEDNWFRLPPETRQKYASKFGAILRDKHGLVSRPMGGRRLLTWDKTGKTIDKGWMDPIGPGMPIMENLGPDAEQVLDRSHLTNYIIGEQVPYILRGERHPDLRSPSDVVYTAAKEYAGMLSIPELLREYRNKKAADQAYVDQAGAEWNEKMQPKGTRPR